MSLDYASLKKQTPIWWRAVEGCRTCIPFEAHLPLRSNTRSFRIETIQVGWHFNTTIYDTFIEDAAVREGRKPIEDIKYILVSRTVASREQAIRDHMKSRKYLQFLGW